MTIEELRAFVERAFPPTLREARALLAAIDVCEAADKLLQSQDDPAYYVLLSDRSDRFDSALRGEEKP